MSEWKARRFWKTVSIRAVDGGGHEVFLDDRALRTPGKLPLILPTAALAEALAQEWQAQGDLIQPQTMPLTRAANSAVEKVAPQFDAVAGGETAGIPFAAWIAERLALPMLYVRKKPKGFGRDAQIEGAMAEGARVLLVEDLTTDGGSKVRFAEALRVAGATVDHTFVLFFYDIFAGTRETLAGHGLRLHNLATWRDVLGEAGAHLDEGTVAEVRDFLGDPLGWSDAHGGAYAPT